jgi:Pyrimidine dimer DNA glycosylase
MVNTFIISNDPRQTFKILDMRRLGKQRLEARTIIQILEGTSKGRGYANHPITKMWTGYVDGLKFYFNCCIDEWAGRGYKNTMEKYELPSETPPLPWWFFNEQVHEAMKASLLRKDEKYYSSRISLTSQEYSKFGYVWTNRLTKEQVQDMKNGVVIPLEEICERVSKD